MLKDMTIKINTDYLKYIVDSKYLPFADLTREQKTLIMKSIFRDKIIKNIYSKAYCLVINNSKVQKND